MSAHGLTRRTFVKGSALAAAALARPFTAHAAGTPPNERVNVAMVGVGQRMLLDLHGALRKHWDGGMMNVVALCDPNDRAGLNDKFAQKGWPILRKELAGVPRFRDYRKKLQYDPETIRIMNDAHANRFLRREYRKAFDAWRQA